MNKIYIFKIYIKNMIYLQKKKETSSTSSPFTPLQIREKGLCLLHTIESYNVQRISRHRLRILDKLGEGNFGLVRMNNINKYKI